MGRVHRPHEVWHLLDDGRIQCDVCPRACKLREGQRGLCFVRARLDDQVVLTNYGLVRLLHRPHREEAAQSLPARQLGAVVRHCRVLPRLPVLPELGHLEAREVDTLADQASPEALAAAAARLGCRSVAFTYNDPVVFHEYAIDVADACHEVGVKAVAVTAGYVCPEPRAEFYEHMDAANVDLKAFTEEFYRHTCGGQLEAVKDTLRYLRHETSIWLRSPTCSSLG